MRTCFYQAAIMPRPKQDTPSRNFFKMLKDVKEVSKMSFQKEIKRWVGTNYLL